MDYIEVVEQAVVAVAVVAAGALLEAFQEACCV